MTPSAKIASLVLSLIGLLALAACESSDDGASAPPLPPESVGYPTTLDQTFIVVPVEGEEGAYTLAVGPGEPREPRNDLSALPSQEPVGDPLSLGYFVVVTDTHMTDEEAPARLDFFDSNLIVNGLFEAAWRAHEDLAPHILSALVDAANQIMAQTGRAFDAALVLGDVTDSAQANEMLWGLDALDAGGRSSGVPGLLRPDSGLLDLDPETGRNRGERSLGFQGTDPEGNPIDPFNRPGRPNSNADLAVPGFRGPDGASLPIRMVVGNHDVLNTGNFDPTSNLTFFRPEDYTGPLAKYGFQPGLANVVQFIRENPGFPVFIADGIFRTGLDYARLLPLLEAIGMVPADVSSEINPHFDLLALQHDTPADGSDDGVPIPADTARAYLGRGGFIRIAHEAGYGFADTDGNGQVSEGDGGWYATDLGELQPDRALPLRLLALNSTDAGRLAGGGYSAEQLAWLQAELDRAVSDQVLAVVLSHHPLDDTSEGAEEFTAMLLACPNVILHLAGHTHVNRVTAVRPSQGGTHGYWQVETASTLNFPQQARIVEIVDNRDGTGSILLTMLDHSVPDWTNLDHLAALGRWVGFEDELKKGYDGHSGFGGLGAPPDRNRELLFTIPPEVAQRLSEIPATEPVTSREGF